MHSTTNSKPFVSWLAIAWRLFLREFGRGELTIIAVSIVLAVSAVMALSSVTDRVEQAIMSKSAAFIAADRDLSSAHPIDDALTEYAQKLELKTDRHIYFSSMAFAKEAMNIAVVKAVTPSYPLRGELIINKGEGYEKIITNGPEKGEVWISKRLFYALDLDEQKLGTITPPQIEVGELSINVTGIIVAEPDAPFEIFNSGTRIIMNQLDVPATDVIQPGSRISYRD